MDKMPKRRKHQDNPYTLKKDEEKGIYIVNFRDSLGIDREVAISKELFKAFNEFELKDLSELNEYDNHIEHLQINENRLNEKARHKELNIEDNYIRKSTFEDLNKAIDMLPKVQRRRIKKYYFEELTLKEIAKEENCTKMAIKFSIDNAIKNLFKILKKYKN